MQIYFFSDKLLSGRINFNLYWLNPHLVDAKHKRISKKLNPVVTLHIVLFFSNLQINQTGEIPVRRVTIPSQSLLPSSPRSSQFSEYTSLP
ncbi:MAG: hypothetical protein Q8880_10750 [Bacteroidota bacterium]|nr:hypothetical protein [Bacteroidota bacterium]